MTEELNIFDEISEDEWTTPTIQDAPMERFEFSTYRFACRKKVTFESGALLEVPEIVVNGQPFMRNGMKEGGRNTAYFLEVTGEKVNGEEYTWVDILFANNNIKLTKEKIETLPPFFISKGQQKRLDKEGFAYFSLWTNFYQTEIGKFSPEMRKQISMGKPFHAKTRIVNYAKRPQIDKATDEPVLDDEGNQKYWYDSYRTDWQLFDTVEQLKAAKEEYWADSGSGASSLDFTYPASWEGDNLKSTLNHFKEMYKENPNLEPIAKFFNDPKGGILKDSAGDEVNWKAILAHTLDLPEALITVNL